MANEAPVMEAKTPERVMINYRAKRLLVVHGKQSGMLTSKLTAPNAVLTAEEVEQMNTVGKAIHIIPGLHSYSSAAWDSIKDHPQIKALVGDGELEIQTKAALGQVLKAGEDAKTPAVALPKNLANIDAGRARDLADNVQDIELLKVWLSEEKTGGKRSSVIDALELQIQKITEVDAKIKASTK